MSTPRRTAKLAVYAAVTALALSACGGDDGGDDDGVDESAEEGADGDGDGAEAMPGLEACDDDPVNCNTGERAEGGEITFLVNQGHDSAFNQLRTEGNSVYLLQMETGLYTDPQFGGAGEYLPDGTWEWNLDLLASEPEVVSEDPFTVNYVIRDEAVWSDGEPINVDDVRWLWYHQSGREEHCTECNPADTTFYAETESIEANDDAGKDFTITYEDGFVHPEWFSRFLIAYPAHVAAEQGDWENDPDAVAASSEHFLNTTPTVFSGPYVVEDWVTDETQVMVPNDNWYGETQPTLDTVIKQVIPDQPSWVPAMQNTEIHGGTPASFTPDILEQLGELPGVYTGVGSRGAVWEHVDMNMDVMDDLALRQAIFTALDTADARERIWGPLEDLGFDLPPYRQNFVFPQASDFFEDHLTETGYGTGDVEAARAILEEAGYTGFEPDGTLTDPDGEPVADIRFRFLAGNENRNTFVQLSQSYLAEIGITVTPDAIPPDQLGTVLSEADFDMVIFGWSGSPLFATGPNQFYNSQSGSNFGNLVNEELDEILLSIANQPTQEEAAVPANEAVQIVMDEAYSLPLWDTPNMAFVSDQYVDIRDNHATGMRAYYNVAEWGMAAAQ